jgi:tRNA nucleotidyltransferase (CCA-adding enzyme)
VPGTGSSTCAYYTTENHIPATYLCYNGCMHLILTHEQADFDALAALFAASLLDGALPVLPRRTNRNVRAFLTLYGADFPFVDPRDLPPGPLDSVTLVDTQSLITLKGMGKATRINVFDHHPHRNPPKSAAGADWNVVTFDLGATTTYFAEVLQERSEELTSIQATLLLLGIYEDTGTLTYSRTTARDVHAAAWLLEQGADLGVVADFLNPPLTLEQREVYDRLVAGIETLDINGHRVMLACGEAANVTEEISTLAHKLRDLFDPDALFVLVQTVEGVRFVARSTTDQIDVSVIAAHFSGGGHDRAAAALVRKEQAEGQPSLLGEVRAELLAILPKHVRAAVTVAQLMSKRPRVLPADTPVQEAAKLMARYGYEGFPVVDAGKVVGLLTRRAVDRAVSHRLNLTAASLMEAGAVTVHPADSLQHLQTVMTDSGWGQIPVVEPETFKVVGIVTRTDVLKWLSRRHPHSPQHRSLAEKLQKGLPPEQLALIRAVADEAASEHLPVYIVGGFVRDLLLGSPSLDFDMVVEGDAIALAKSLAQKYGGKVTSHSRFGTAKWNLETSSLVTEQLPFLDLISSRQEYYEHPTALPTVEHGSIKLDLHRRDFTINTLALRLDGRHFGELHDYYGGLPDLERRLVRVLHSLSFVDDPTRMLRAVRYEQRYGFKIEPRTLQLMNEARPLMARLSDERVRHELDLILGEPNAAWMLARLDELGLLKAIAEVLPWSSELRGRLDSALRLPLPSDWELKPPTSGISLNEVLTYILWLLDLPVGEIDALHKRLRFPVSTLKTIRAAAELRADLPALRGGKPSQWVDRLDGVPLLAVYAVYLISAEKALQTYAARWQNIHPKTTGETLKVRGLTPSPLFQNILHALRSAWLDGEVTTDDQENVLLEKLSKELAHDE